MDVRAFILGLPVVITGCGVNPNSRLEPPEFADVRKTFRRLQDTLPIHESSAKVEILAAARSIQASLEVASHRAND